MISNLNIFNKDHLKIVITDSGLGGLSVHAKLDHQLGKWNCIGEIDLIFFNAFAGYGFGYNELKIKEEKLIVFDSALEAMSSFEPDIILIACNTLSALFPLTKFSRESRIPVHGIIDFGIDLVIEKVNGDENYNILIVGTETTVNSQMYQKLLIEKGIDAQKIFSKGCKNLENEIQIDPYSNVVKELITKYIDEGSDDILSHNPEKIYLLLACTHYGYSKEIFYEVCKKKFNREIILLNPNEKMVEVSLKMITDYQRSGESISNKVYSKVRYSDERINSLASLIEKDSPDLSMALKQYKYDKELFAFEL